ncbi:hypothetical protein, partial [Burkholderia gladioli]|uniref:hypothetical protein n=1 Tax=Burkholderia gladioli TaxID=28095 RepID=UPI001ABA9548
MHASFCRASLAISVIRQPLQLPADRQALHRNLELEPTAEIFDEKLPVSLARQHNTPHTLVVTIGYLLIDLLLDSLGPRAARGDPHSIQRLLVGLDHRSRGGQAVLRREDVPITGMALDKGSRFLSKPSINDALPMVGRRSDAKCPRGHMHSDR